MHAVGQDDFYYRHIGASAQASQDSAAQAHGAEEEEGGEEEEEEEEEKIRSRIVI